MDRHSIGLCYLLNGISDIKKPPEEVRKGQFPCLGSFSVAFCALVSVSTCQALAERTAFRDRESSRELDSDEVRVVMESRSSSSHSQYAHHNHLPSHLGKKHRVVFLQAEAHACLDARVAGRYCYVHLIAITPMILSHTNTMPASEQQVCWPSQTSAPQFSQTQTPRSHSNRPESKLPAMVLTSQSRAPGHDIIAKNANAPLSM